MRLKLKGLISVQYQTRVDKGYNEMMGTLIKVVSNDLLPKRAGLSAMSEHQLAAINWLKRAQDTTADGGVSYGYYLRGRPMSEYGFGWRPSYVETSGYIIETFYDVALAHNDTSAALRAEAIGRWLITVQNEDGSFSNESMSRGSGLVFDTGQVLFGLTRCCKETGDTQFLAAAQKASLWLGRQQDEDGAWRKSTHKNIVHSYNARSAWAMLEFAKIANDKNIQALARKNLIWTISQQTEMGLFENASFTPGTAAFTHTIAYVIRGLFEGGLLLGDKTILAASLRAAETVAKHVEPSGFIPGRMGLDGTVDDGFSCLTGNCQMAIIWYKMSTYFNMPDLAKAANKTMDYVQSCQDIKTENLNIKGAVKGSEPIWGGYTPLAYPNWATKFFIEALLLKEERQAHD